MTSCGERVPSDFPFDKIICNAQCFPFDAAALADDDGAGGWDGGQISPAKCGVVCAGGSSGGLCSAFEDGGASFIRCEPIPCLGRRPAGLVLSDCAQGTLLGAYFAEMASLEAASVYAFRHLRRELVEHGAPRRLIRAAERAARDEIRHARMTAALARRYGGILAVPNVEPRRVRDVEAIARENAVEGCARETFGALVATWQATAAGDPVIRAAMARIARDETRHAALAFEVDAWLRRRLDSPARVRIDEARRAAFVELADGSMNYPEALRVPLGLPSSHQARTFVEAIERLAA